MEFYQENGPSHHGRVVLLNQLDQFTIDGWLALLVGMRVPHRSPFQPSERESAEWRRIGEQLKQQALGAMTVKEALEAIQLPQWRWSKDFYRPIPPLLRA